MASRSMHYLRKHQKVILVVVGVILMVMFTVGSFLNSPSDLFGGPSQADLENPIVATWKGGAIREADIAQLRQKHNAAVSFVSAVIGETIATAAARSSMVNRSILSVRCRVSAFR
jgi:hypothetical protein